MIPWITYQGGLMIRSNGVHDPSIHHVDKQQVGLVASQDKQLAICLIEISNGADMEMSILFENDIK
jgi:hypothetical protein